MIQRTIWTSFACLLIAVSPASFAGRVVSCSNLQPGIYSDPNAILGPPTSWVRDTSPNGGAGQRIAVMPGYSAWNVTPAGAPTLVGLGQSGQITVEFTLPLRNDPRNWYGRDFIVYGNAFVAVSQPVTWNANLNNISIMAGPDWVEPMAVSVSPDGLQWYTYAVTNMSGADGYWPTAAFQWDYNLSQLGTNSRWDKPVPPALTRPEITGMTIAQAVAAFQGSGGGTSFDLAETGFSFVRFVRISGTGGEVDAVSRVSPAPLPTSAQRLP